MGLTMAPFVSMIQSVDPIVLPASLLMTAGIFGGSAFVALKSSVDFARWKGPLMVGLGCLLGTQLVGLASLLIAGPSSGLAMLLHNVDIYGGIGLFTLMTMYVYRFTCFTRKLLFAKTLANTLKRYDSHVAKQLYLKGEPDDLGKLAYELNKIV